MDRGQVARSAVDRRRRGPKAPEHGSALTGAWPPATPEHESSSARAQQREGNMGNSARASPGLGRWRGDQATAGKQRRRESSATATLRLRKRGRVRWGRCGDLRGQGGQFIGPEEGAPRR
jgi:hypothetical protein